ILISMEPMEALRYLPMLASDAVIITSSKPFVNIPNYPSEDKVIAELKALPNVVMADIEAVAREAGNPKGANMVLLGMAAKYLSIVSVESLREALAHIFARKGEAIVEANLKCFDKGLEL
ncbi:MAG: 2-oxoacid:acceptor oxidoreductase family protein, partial [Bacteroidales bacterium]|nr:2-oxoacid:acceptor oxidoreductase family protein [Bacteroidales bacterium]